MNSYYTENELREVGFKKIGKNVQVSRNTSIYQAQKISIGDNVRIDDFCIMSGEIKIGNNVHIAAGVYIFSGNSGVVIKDYAGISSRTAIYANTDDYSGSMMTNPTIPDKYREVTGGTVILEEHVLIGTGCTILPGVTIGKGSSVGSMSLINKSLSAWGMYVGIPCRWIKERSKKLLECEKKYREELSDRVKVEK